VYKSTDGGHTFTGFRGAPGGDDYHSIWIAPDDPDRMIISSDQGTIVTLNGGDTWSSWYNQPTAQLYHVATDNRFPYWLYAAQQDSGAVAVPSRSDHRAITERDWEYVAVGGESGMLAPDPLNTDIVFGGTVGRWDWKTRQVEDVSPTLGRTGEFRTIWTLPLVFSQADKTKLYFSHQMLFRTMNGGKTWDQISPDLTRENPPAPENLDPITAKYGLASPRKGVIYAIAPSPIAPNTIWVGTDDGTIHVTFDDGKTWKDVTPNGLKPWSKVGIIDASHFDKESAYAAIDAHRIEDMTPYIYRTHDGGKSWQVLGKGIPKGAFVNAVREDTVRKGLLFAGTELGVYVSFDDGENWQPLQLNLPVSSVRDLAIHGSDLSVATHGRSFWILDDITPLREIGGKDLPGDAYLFRPAEAVRTRPGDDQSTPYPKDIPHGENPPNGAVIDYYLKTDSPTPVVLEIFDSKGDLIRRYASDDKIAPIVEKNLVVTTDWVKGTPALSAQSGMHRWIWDFQTTPAVGEASRRRGGGGNWAVPDQYTVKLTANGQTYTQPLTLKMDPRVKVTQADLLAQFNASQQSVAAANQLVKPASQGAAIEKQISELVKQAQEKHEVLPALRDFQKKLTEVLGPPPGAYGTPVIPAQTDFTSVRYVLGALRQTQAALQSADVAPTPDQLKALKQYEAQSRSSLANWQALLNVDLPKLNASLKTAGMQQVLVEK
ncbi:MAG TPA: hypothetical protein VF135_09955, partial [Terriglobales bacterium]